MLGDADPEVREATGVATLLSWLRQGVYDDLLGALGDGMAAGLTLGPDVAPTALSELAAEGATAAVTEAAPVLRRAASARVLVACLERAESHALLPDATVLRWADQLLTWFVTDPDRRSLEAGAAAVAQIAASPHLGGAEELVLLDVVADRVLAAERICLADLDALVGAALAVLRRDQLGVEDLEPWVVRLGRAALADTGRERCAEGFLRALYTHAALARTAMAARADLVLLLVDVLREIRPTLSAPPA